MKERFIRFMSGRYGADQLSRFMLAVCFLCLILNLFTGTYILYVAALAILVVCYFRMFSRNLAKRDAENQQYLRLKEKFLSIFKRSFWEERKAYHIYKCPSCGQKIRIPRGKGKICITCPKCRNEFVKKS
ncbi:MAG TPA: hypothetical protein IAB84_05475 [Candidatus Choladousia intestinigallinarum]|nr:hypothetical protein [Candidatus Choladousia intestinigallinarum]